jgi:hypothetical protein
MRAWYCLCVIGVYLAAAHASSVALIEPVRHCAVRQACAAVIRNPASTELDKWDCLGEFLFGPVSGDPQKEYFVEHNCGGVGWGNQINAIFVSSGLATLFGRRLIMTHKVFNKLFVPPHPAVTSWSFGLFDMDRGSDHMGPDQFNYAVDGAFSLWCLCGCGSECGCALFVLCLFRVYLLADVVPVRSGFGSHTQKIGNCDVLICIFIRCGCISWICRSCGQPTVKYHLQASRDAWRCLCGTTSVGNDRVVRGVVLGCVVCVGRSCSFVACVSFMSCRENVWICKQGAGEVIRDTNCLDTVTPKFMACMRNNHMDMDMYVMVGISVCLCMGGWVGMGGGYGCLWV